jgi:hypothetical protein
MNHEGHEGSRRKSKTISHRQRLWILRIPSWTFVSFVVHALTILSKKRIFG